MSVEVRSSLWPRDAVERLTPAPWSNHHIDLKRGDVDLSGGSLQVRGFGPSHLRGVGAPPIAGEGAPPLPCITSDWITALAPSVRAFVDGPESGPR
jgi:hypothetical protein